MEEAAAVCASIRPRPGHSLPATPPCPSGTGSPRSAGLGRLRLRCRRLKHCQALRPLAPQEQPLHSAGEQKPKRRIAAGAGRLFKAPRKAV